MQSPRNPSSKFHLFLLLSKVQSEILYCLQIFLDGGTPLLPETLRFNFSPSAVNRILGQDTTPSVLKAGGQKTNSRRSFTPVRLRENNKSPAISPILNYTVPVNSPANLKMPPPKPRRHHQKTSTNIPMSIPSVSLVNPNGEKVHNLILGATLRFNSEQDKRENSILNNTMNTPTSGGSASSGTVMMDSSFDAVVKAASKSPPEPVHIVTDHAHLDEQMSVVNILDDINMSHLGTIFEREEVR